MIGIAFKTLGGIFSPALRGVFWRSIALTILILVVMCGGLIWIVDYVLQSSVWLDSYPWLETFLGFLTGFGILLAGLYVLPAVSMLVAGFFLDDVAEHIEKFDYAGDRPGTPLPTTSSLIESLRFFVVTLGANLLALCFLFVPLVNIAAFFIVNAFLFGREYFFLVAGRHESRATVVRLYQVNQGRIFASGALISFFIFIPVLNLLTPLFATVLMVHMYKRIRQSGHHVI